MIIIDYKKRESNAILKLVMNAELHETQFAKFLTFA